MRRILEHIKSILLIFLVVSMLALWTGYIYLQFDRANEDNEILKGDLWVFTDVEQAPSEITPDNKFLLPESVSIILSGKGYTSAFNTELTRFLYYDCETLITEIFSQPYVCEKTSYSSWENALAFEDTILIEFETQLPYTTIANFFAKSDNFCNGEICNIKAMILYSDKSTSAPSAIAIDDGENTYSFSWRGSDSPSLIYDFNGYNLAAYTVNEGFIPFEFNKNIGEAKRFENLPSEYKLLLEPPMLNSILVSNPMKNALDMVLGENDEDFSAAISEERISGILSSFNINPQVIGYYSDAYSGLNFVGEDVHLIIEPTGKIVYTLINKASVPITTSSLLNTARMSFNSQELLSAATAFISKLSPELVGGEAELVLRSVSYSRQTEEMQFSFGYMYNLTNVAYNNESTAVTLSFNSKGLVGATIIPMNVTSYEGEEDGDSALLKTDIIPSVVAQIMGDSFTKLKPIYSVNDYDTIITPVWAMGGK